MEAVSAMAAVLTVAAIPFAVVYGIELTVVIFDKFKSRECK